MSTTTSPVRPVEARTTLTHGIAGQIMASVRVTMSDGTFYRTTFWASAYGGPVFVQILDDIVRVDNPRRHGTTFDATWVAHYYGL